MNLLRYSTIATVLLVFVIFPDVTETIFSSVAVNLPEFESLTPLTGGRAVVCLFLVAQLILFSILSNVRQRRSVDSVSQRTYFQQLALMTTMKYDTEGCVMKAVCGISASGTAAMDTSFILLMKLLSSPPATGVSSDLKAEWLKYQQAIYLGSVGKSESDCESVYNKCSFSMKEMKMMITVAYSLLKDKEN